jgi:hypothetical protein
MWIEERPIENDTVKVEFADWTKLGTQIGVVNRFFNGYAIVDFGGHMRYLDINTTFFVFKS